MVKFQNMAHSFLVVNPQQLGASVLVNLRAHSDSFTFEHYDFSLLGLCSFFPVGQQSFTPG